MSDQDNLRNRIAEVIHGTKSPLHDHGQAQAQAVIDELGLTTETHAATHAKRTMTRITSKWEWNN